jgi:1,2-diacylglycerol 3-alpha-glucosyltransferase
MKIAMFSNTYSPHVGGVARSVEACEIELRRRGHDVCIIAPMMEGHEDSSEHILRVPSIPDFNGSGFALRLPQPFLISDFIDDFKPDVIHTHHPFLLGDAALRTAYARRLPLVFTHHTMYEQYTHYLPFDSESVKRVAVQIAAEYCNLCHHVIAPSKSVEILLQQRGVTAPITTIPTGIDTHLFDSGDRNSFRESHGIRHDAVVIGHVGRLTEEKNLHFLAEAVGVYLSEHPNAVFLIVGDGDSSDAMKTVLTDFASSSRFIFVGRLVGQKLYDAYAAMDLFVFASQSETQGLVLAEALAAGTPVVALDGPGVREIIEDRNGRLLDLDATAASFADAMSDLTADTKRLSRIAEQARRSVKCYDLRSCADRLENQYQTLMNDNRSPAMQTISGWERLEGRLEAEWKLLVEKSTALTAVLVETEATTTLIP